MAFTQANLNCLQAGVQSLYAYNGTDTAASIAADYFFDNDLLRANDIILVVSETGGTPAMDVLAVSAVDATGVKTAALA